MILKSDFTWNISSTSLHSPNKQKLSNANFPHPPPLKQNPHTKKPLHIHTCCPLIFKVCEINKSEHSLPLTRWDLIGQQLLNCFILYYTHWLNLIHYKILPWHYKVRTEKSYSVMGIGQKIHPVRMQRKCTETLTHSTVWHQKFLSWQTKIVIAHLVTVPLLNV